MNIIIAGGGIAGATLALALSRLSQGALPVTVIEASEPGSQQHPGYDSRAIALADGTCQQLATLKIWPHLQATATAIREVQVSDLGHAGFVRLGAESYGVSALGQVVELHDVGKVLFRLLRSAPGISLHCPDRIVQVCRETERVSVVLESGTVTEGSLLVAADGSRSGVAASCGLHWQQESYGQVAVIANVTTSEHHRGRAFERFTENGPVALLPMSQGRCSLVWCHPLSHRDQLNEWDDTFFLRQLQQAFGWRLGAFTTVGQRTSYPLTLQKASQRISHRLALVGNAAQTLHPIAGQGFNLGLRDVMTLAETLIAAWQKGEDPGCHTVLRRYQVRRQADVDATIGLTDGLVRLFSGNHLPLVAARNIGLLAMNFFPPLRHPLAERMLGWVKR
ncbi:2-octaprenyl-6-methoxyphenyl hydroxylase [Erwinia typographi]|uniref:2-octaprenyl-6-methoxyphenyl hydroxylase n=1 Tax=Erwinia typographi TaxID=371042 RepID=A0A0A4A083_9GAMM|nr:2-octaprenyl-6-methoxyphenyl hydroxylase [Erwinia typographi]KGT91278.1 2-octaprenyl-6-methoxyphenyl hydroxylase [Erwinia typographi]